MNILGFNPSHHGSVCLLQDGEIKYFLQEERLTRRKYDSHPFKTIFNVINNYPINYLTWAPPSLIYYCDNTNPSSYWGAFVQSFTKNQIYLVDHSNIHHIAHGAHSFYNSGFKKSLILVVDGNGSIVGDRKNIKKLKYETESIFIGEYPCKFIYLFKNTNNIENNEVTLSKAYESINTYLGFKLGEEGKTMGLSSYGKPNSLLPTFLDKNKKGKKEIFNVDNTPNYSPLDVGIVRTYAKNLPNEVSKEDIAYQIQQETQKAVGDYIEKAIKKTNIKQICCSGGYFLNCVANYYLQKRFPDVKFYFEPIANDAGIAIGAAKLVWHSITKDTTIRPFKSLYLGPKYSLNQLKKSIKNYKSTFIQHKTTYKQIAKLISERNIITIFQGRSEAGPRALGNRSILYDPTDPNGKDFVNKVKKREWFRPFAGTVLKEKAHEYFDMVGLEESPFMMYAMDVWPDKQEQIQAITHVDGTCRIQTVTEEQNPHYYKLIQEFEKITGVPILFNTSFNLAGDPLVETIEDALETLLKSELKYLYLPELEMLLEKKDQ